MKKRPTQGVGLLLARGSGKGGAALARFADMGEAVGQQHDEGTNPGGVHQAEVLHHETADHGAQRNADVEGGDVEAGGHIHGIGVWRSACFTTST